MQPHLFDMFFQGDSSKERRYGGLGIGLTLARRIVEFHVGRIEVNKERLHFECVWQTLMTSERACKMHA